MSTYYRIIIEKTNIEKDSKGGADLHKKTDVYSHIIEDPNLDVQSLIATLVNFIIEGSDAVNKEKEEDRKKQKTEK